MDKEDLQKAIKSQTLINYGNEFLIDNPAFGFDTERNEMISIGKDDNLVIFHSDGEAYLIGNAEKYISNGIEVDSMIEEGRKLRDGLVQSTAEFKENPMTWVDRAIAGRNEDESRGTPGFSKS